jgi:hypothetical protein
MDHPLYSPDLAPADLWLFLKLESVLKGKCFSATEDIKSSVKKILTFLFRILKTVLNNGQSTGNTDWREITLKNSRLLISAALKFQKN